MKDEKGIKISNIIWIEDSEKKCLIAINKQNGLLSAFETYEEEFAPGSLGALFG